MLQELFKKAVLKVGVKMSDSYKEALSEGLMTEDEVSSAPVTGVTAVTVVLQEVCSLLEDGDELAKSAPELQSAIDADDPLKMVEWALKELYEEEPVA